MKILFRISMIAASVGFLVSTAWAGHPDPRFDGIWKGEETFRVFQSSTQFARAPERKTAVFAISDNGKTFGILQGHGEGRYEVSSRSGGNKLVFKGSTSHWRSEGTLVLSSDGKTLTETGFGFLPGKPQSVKCNISGTFHRKK